MEPGFRLVVSFFGTFGTSDDLDVVFAACFSGCPIKIFYDMTAAEVIYDQAVDHIEGVASGSYC